MSDPRYLFYDTCFYIDWFRGNISSPPKLPVTGPTLIVGHAVVIMELYQGVRSAQEGAAIERIEKLYEIIGPSIGNYLAAGKILKQMTEKGWLMYKRLYELQNDVLLALSAIENKAYIITRNKKDFDRIKKFCDVKILYY